MIAVKKSELHNKYKWPTSRVKKNNFLETKDLNIVGSKKIVANKNSDDVLYLVNNHISRFDDYYASLNFKATFLIIGNITFFGFLLSSFDKINIYIFNIHVLLMLISLAFVLIAIKQYFKIYKGKNSLLLFKDIINMESNMFIDKIDSLSKANYIQSLKEQNIILAHGLILKMNYLYKSSIFSMFNIILLFLCIHSYY